MKRYLFIPVALVLIGGVALFTSCAQEEDEEEVHPLVGTWDMTDLEQTSTYYADTDAYAAYGISDGDSLGQGTLTWAEFSAMGVEATVVLNDDGSFTLTGKLPQASDTLGLAPTIVPLTDQGSWTAPEDLTTLSIDGAIYDLGGVLTLDDEKDPQVISLYYTETAAPDTVVVVIDANQDGVPDTPLDNFPITEDSETTLEFTRVP